MSEIKVNSIKGVGSTDAAITINNSDGTCTANLTNKPNRNLIINGAMQVAQRGTSSTTQNGYGTVDRTTVFHSGTGANITSSQVDVASGTPPYQSGFRKALQITKGAGTAATSSQINLAYQIEAQDIANSGWDYTNPNSFLTFSFWVKTSVANHNPQVAFVDMDSSQGGTKNYQFEVPTLTANTWTKITHSIPGHADQVYDNNNAVGIHFYIFPWIGTDYTDNSNTMNAWSSFGMKDMDTTWLTTNNSTFQVTGMQLELGSVATDFEHRSFGQELALCQRYFYKWVSSIAYSNFSMGFANSATDVETVFQLPQDMRASPSLSTSGTFRLVGYNSSGQSVSNLGNLQIARSHPRSLYIRATASGMTRGQIGEWGDSGSNNATFSFSAEL